jgi:glycosyltransferase involved in cell wall biosynthesis
MNGNPSMLLITVAMPIYNAGNYLRLAVQSILAQTYPNWELLIIDDKSTDSSLDSIADIRDPRITILRDGTNKGLAARLNQAIDMAKGQYIARMDQDDISYPERFARQIELLSRKPELDLVAVRAIRISGQNEALDFFPSPLSHDQICKRPWLGFYLPHPTWMGRVEWFRKHRYKIPQSYFCEDQELLLRSYRESTFACVDEVLFAYRVRDKVDPGKLRKTRRAVFSIQAAHFRAGHQYHYLILALAAFLSRIWIDYAKQLKQRFRPAAGKAAMHESMQAEAGRWEQLESHLQTSGTKSRSRQ